MTISKTVQPCWHLKKLLWLKPIQFIKLINWKQLKVKTQENSWMLILVHKDNLMLIETDSRCIKTVKCQWRVFQNHQTLSGFTQRPIARSQSNSLTMVLLHLIAFKEISVTAGWSVPWACSPQETSSSLVVELEWNWIQIWSSIKKSHRFYQKVYILLFSIDIGKLVCMWSEFSKTSLGFTLSLMKGFQ